ncbi:phosphoribosylformylglycinamidine synthase subunit PurL [Sulfuriroseicoccus oceanibius]|uniref:Phosphoribosylformylglycinamidine synthase subunit PurL n=1 Tax=Sulfuriroseicoccus oceanibius TaxID=2707525 RepID=A0A6B3L2A9_9BACT|nr:phosphoribosylformylglycinamidine synthase subunit PurL [Sulfuriroseicoccus oceanibius]QQL44128.1 phosphoribosylformylglycinamidine synthase subunit PurL [Sulfuriroseicoccus oceanibius]
MSIHTTEANYRSVPVRDLDADALVALSGEMKLSLSREDMLAVQAYYNEAGREPTDVELEVIAQTWSEHCKHRIFSANIEHTTAEGTETVDSLFKTYIMKPSLELMERKPGFVLSAFHDNAGFIRLDDDKAICLKVETHNHPSALEPYAGANTGIGGVVRDILGAGKGAKPIASLDVFCFGAPDTPQGSIKGKDVIHPLGVMRGVVRGVRDYGNRMGIPTVAGAIQFDPSYTYNPLVFCGTAGVIPIKDIDKEMRPGLKIIAVGGRTGRDGLKGATFSSASLTGDSHAEDQSAVQIGNPIEEKKVGDFILKAREEELIVFVTDCGAGGFSSAAGEMLSETGGELFLENAPLKEPGLFSWEVFLSESQERMVLAVEEEALPRLRELAATYETELTVLGHSDDSGILKVLHHGEMVCELDNSKLHNAPQRQMKARWVPAETRNDHQWPEGDFGMGLKTLLNGFTICSRSPIIREYDHEVQGNTLLKPLAGAKGDAPQDGSVIEIDGSEQAMSLGLSLLPEWGKYDPYRMGLACVDECVRSLVLTGSEPDRIAILDNFCVGNPDDEEELGALVETVKGIAKAADAFGAPFVSGKDSFYNYFETEDGPVSIPTTILVSGMGVVEEKENVLGSSIRRDDSVVAIIGNGSSSMGGSVYARRQCVTDAEVPDTDLDLAVKLYKALAKARKGGGILSAHDVSEGGLAVTLAEMTFSEKAGLEVSLNELPGSADDVDAVALFNEGPSRIVLELDPAKVDEVAQAFDGLPFAVIGQTTGQHKNLIVTRGNGSEQRVLIDEDIDSLKSLWKTGLTPFY